MWRGPPSEAHRQSALPFRKIKGSLPCPQEFVPGPNFQPDYIIIHFIPSAFKGYFRGLPVSRAELHKIPARVQCTVQCADWIDEPAPPTIP
jgi:hypothetical protein